MTYDITRRSGGALNFSLLARSRTEALYLWRLYDGVDNAVDEDSRGAFFRFDAEENSSETEQRKQHECRTSRRSVHERQTTFVRKDHSRVQSPKQVGLQLTEIG